jgi:hypothetical protein
MFPRLPRWVCYLQIILSKLVDTTRNGIGKEPHRIAGEYSSADAEHEQELFREYVLLNNSPRVSTIPASSTWIIVCKQMRPSGVPNGGSLVHRVVNDFHMVCHDPQKIADNLWIGNAFDAANYKFLQSEGIMGIVNITCEVPNFFVADGIQYCNIVVRDVQDADIAPRMFEASAQFIDRIKQQGGSVLVHCFVGRSRSVATICYYLMTREQHTFVTAYQHVRSIRPFSQINANFARLLCAPPALCGNTSRKKSEEKIDDEDGERTTPRQNIARE